MFMGSGVALVTPFKKNGEIDYEALEKLVNYHINHKTDALIVCGTTGEAPTLSCEEHLECLAAAKNFANGRIPIIAGTGSNNTKTAIDNSTAAEKIGVDGLLLVTPYYNKTTQTGLEKHYKEIASNVDIPIILYNVPSRTGLNIEPETFRHLYYECDNIIGIKEASGNISNVAQIMELTNGDAWVYSGNDDQVVPILSLGGVGVISVVANIMPDIMHEMVYDYLEGKVEDSREKQLQILRLAKDLFSEVNPIPIKKAMELMGMINGTLRPPLCDMSPKNTVELKNEMIKQKLLKS